MPAILSKECLHRISLIRNQFSWYVERIDHQNHFNRRFGLDENSIKCLKGENPARLAVVQQSKVPALQAGYHLSVGIRRHHIKLDQARAYV